MSQLRIPDVNERNAVNKVISDLLYVSDVGSEEQVTGNVAQAYNLLKQNDQIVTELRLKEVLGSLNETSAGDSDPFAGLPKLGGRSRSSNGFQGFNGPSANSALIRQGRGEFGLGQEFGVGRQATEADNMMTDPSLKDSTLDFLGTTAWNFLDSLTIGGLGLAYEKLLKPTIGENGFTDFIDGMKQVDTDAGKWGEALGVTASFLLPGGLLGGAGKAGKAVNKMNFIGKAFGTGGKVMRRATGVTGAIEKTGAKVTGEVIKGVEGQLEKGIIANQDKIMKLKKVSASTFDSIKKVEKMAEKGVHPILSRSDKAILGRASKIKELQGEIKAAQRAKERVGGIEGSLKKALKRTGEEFYNLRRKTGAGQLNQLGSKGMAAEVNNIFKGQIADDIYAAVGNRAVGDQIIGDAAKLLEKNVDGILKGTVTWGEKLAAKGILGGEKIGSILQNGADEAIGFAWHSLIHSNVKSFTEMPEYNSENLMEAAKKSMTEAVHSAGTAFVFAAGGGVPFLGGFTAPLKLLAPTRRTELGEVFNAFWGKGVKANSLAVGGSFDKILKAEEGLAGLIKSLPKRGMKGLSEQSILQRLRQRGIVDYRTLANKDPEAIVNIVNSIKKLEENAELTALRNAGANIGSAEMNSALRDLQLGLLGKEGKSLIKGSVAEEALQSLVGMLEKRATNAVERRASGIFTDFLSHDLLRNAATGVSIFYGANGQDIIDQHKAGYGHLSDIVTHAVFSMSAGSHGLHKFAGRPMGGGEYNEMLSLPERVLMQDQNRAFLQSLGVNAGDSFFLKSLKGEEMKEGGVDFNNAFGQFKRGFTDLTDIEVGQMEIVPSNQEVVNNSKQVRADELIHTAKVLQEFARGGMVLEGPLEILNPLISKDGVITEESIKLETNDLGEIVGPNDVMRALAAVTSSIKESTYADGWMNESELSRVRFTSEFMDNYAASYSTNILKSMEAISKDGVNRLIELLGREAKDGMNFPTISKSMIEELKSRDAGDLNMSSYEYAQALKILSDLGYGTGLVSRTSLKSDVDVINTVEDLDKLIKIIDETHTQLVDRFGTGLKSRALLTKLEQLTRLGYAGMGKRVFADHDKRVVVVDGQQLVIDKNIVTDIAQASGLVKIGNDGRMTFGDVSIRDLKKEGVNTIDALEVKNFLKVLRASQGKNAKGKSYKLTADDISKFKEGRDRKIGDADINISLRKLMRSMGLDFTNSVASNDVLGMVNSAMFSRFTPDKHAMYSAMSEHGLIFDTKDGRFSALFFDEGLPGSKDMPTTNERLIKSLENIGFEYTDKNGKVTKGLSFSHLNEVLKPYLDSFKEVGLLDEGAPDETYFRTGFTDKQIEDQAIAIKKLVEDHDYIKAEGALRSVEAYLTNVMKSREDGPKLEGWDERMLKSERLVKEVVKLMSKKFSTPSDWAKARMIIEKYKAVVDKKGTVNMKRAGALIDELYNMVDNSIAVEAFANRIEQGARNAKGTKSFDPLLGNESDSIHKLADILGKSGLGVKPDDLPQALKDFRLSANNMDAQQFRQYFIEYVNKNGHSVAKLNKKLKGGVNGDVVNAIYNSLKTSRAINIYSLMDVNRPRFKDVATDKKEFESGPEMLVSGVFRETSYMPAGHYSEMSDRLGVEISLLDNMIEVGGVPVNMNKMGSASAKLARERLENMQIFGFDYVRPASKTRASDKEQLNVRDNVKNRTVILRMGDLDNRIIFHLPSTSEGAKFLGNELKRIANLYDHGVSPEFNNVLDSLHEVADLAIAGTLTEGKELEAFVDLERNHDAFSFYQMHSLMGTGNMKKYGNMIQNDNKGAVKLYSRIRQRVARSFTPTDTEAFRQATRNMTDSETIGYDRMTGKLKSLVLSVEDYKAITGQDVDRGDGQVYKLPWLLNALARVNGDTSEPGVMKTSIVDVDGEGNVFLTKNAATNFSRMNEFMEKHGIAVLSIESSVKIGGKTGRILDSGGNKIELDEVLHGERESSEVEGAFDINVSSLRYNKTPHNNGATYASQVENLMPASLTEEIYKHYFSGDTGEQGVLGKIEEMSGDSISDRARLRGFLGVTLSEMENSEFAQLVGDLGREDVGLRDYYAHEDLGSPGDFGWGEHAKGVVKTRLVTNNVFKKKDNIGGSQRILAADILAILNSSEGVMGAKDRDLFLDDEFNNGENGIQFAIKKETKETGTFDDDTRKFIDADVEKRFGIAHDKNFNNKQLAGNDSDVEKELVNSQYIHRRLFRSKKQKKDGHNSFITDALLIGQGDGKTGGIFQFGRIGLEEANQINDVLIDLLADVPLHGIRSNYTKIDGKRFDYIMSGFNHVAGGKYARHGGMHNMGKVYDMVASVLGSYDYSVRNRNSDVGKADVTWGISALNQRYPSARPNDTIPIVFLGFLEEGMGNQVMLNYYDAVLKGESDYDIDNYNYIFNVSERHFAEKIKRRASMGINDSSAGSSPKDATGHMFNPFKEKDRELYAQHNAKSNYLRGAIIKSSSLMDKLIRDEYRIRFRRNKRNYIIRPKFENTESMLDTPEGMKAIMRITGMTQNVLDSKKGLLGYHERVDGTRISFADEKFNAFHEVAREFFEVVELKKDGNSMDKDAPVIDFDATAANMLQSAISPYSDLLTFTKREWVGDSTQSLPWEQTADIALTYYNLMGDEKKRRGNLEKFVTKKMALVDKKYKDITIDFKHSESIASQAAKTILNIDKKWSKTAGSYKFGRRAKDIADLVVYAREAMSGTNDNAVAEFMSQINTKNWSIREAVSNINYVEGRVKTARDKIRRGDNFAKIEYSEAIAELKGLREIKRAIMKSNALKAGGPDDPKLSLKIKETEKRTFWNRSKNAEAIHITMLKMGATPELLAQMEPAVAKIQRERGRLWAETMKKEQFTSRGEAYDQEKNAVLEYLVEGFLREFHDGKDALYDPQIAILALAMPRVEGYYTGGNGETIVGYKKMPNDLLTIATRRRGNAKSMRKLAKEMARSMSLVSRYMNGDTAGLAEMKSIHENIESKAGKFAIATRVNIHKREMYSLAKILRIFAGDRQVAGGDVELEASSIKDLKFNGIDFGDAFEGADFSPEKLVEERLAYGEVSTVNATKGLEVLQRITINNEDSFGYDREGVLYKDSLKIVLAEAEKRGEQIDPKSANTRRLVENRAGKTIRRMIEATLGTDVNYVEHPMNGEGGDYAKNIAMSRTEREGCK